MFRPMTMCIGIPTVDAATAGIAFGSVALLYSDVPQIRQIIVQHIASTDPDYELASLDVHEQADTSIIEHFIKSSGNDHHAIHLAIVGGLDNLTPQRGYIDEPRFVSVCRELKGIAREHDIGILAIGSSRVGISDPVNDDWMGMVDLAMTLEMLTEDESSMGLDIIKNRFGPTGELELVLREGRFMGGVLA